MKKVAKYPRRFQIEEYKTDGCGDPIDLDGQKARQDMTIYYETVNNEREEDTFWNSLHTHIYTEIIEL